MPSKRGSKTANIKTQKKSSTHKKKKYEKSEEDIRNSEDEYTPQSEDDYESQSGGDERESDPESELDSDSAHLDIDPDDEKDPNEDDQYNPVEENEELEDPDEETDIEDEIGETAEEGAEVEAEAAEENIGEEGEIQETGEDGYVGEAKPCHLKNLNKDFIVLDEDDSNMYGKMEYKRIADVDRETDNVMTYYEMVRIIGTRAQQFNFGAEPLIKGLEGLHPAKMAYVELIAKMTPYIIRRHLPGKKYEEWRIDQLEIVHTITDDFFVPEKFDWEALMKQASNLNRPTEIPIKATRKSKTSSSRITKPKSNSKKSKTKFRSGSGKTGSKSNRQNRRRTSTKK